MKLDQLGVDDIIRGRLAPLAYATMDRARNKARAAALRPHALEGAARDLALTRALEEVVAVASGPLLVLKGGAHSRLYYSSSAFRPRSDVDVWVESWDQAREVANRLGSRGATEVHQLPGRFVRHAIAVELGSGVSVDIHARCSRRERLARALPFDLAWEERQRLPGLEAFALGHRHGWLLLAAQIGAHHANQEFLGIHVEDLTRIGRLLAPDDWAEVERIIAQSELRSAIRPIGEAVEAWAPGVMPRTLLHLLEVPDASVAFRHPMLAMLDDLELLEPSAQRRYLAEIAYPPADYLMEQLGVARPRPRPLLALHRGLLLARATLSRRSSRDAA